MTWIIAGNCFNGFACVSDVQVTVDPHGRGQLQYYNCLKKTHVVCNNLCVAFSGDVRTGLLLIKSLKDEIPHRLNDGEYFDIDGQSAVLISGLKKVYRQINPRTQPYVELVFCWNAQEGDDLYFRPFCMRFRSPDFLMNSTSQIGLTSFGSGASQPGYRDIRAFLSGDSADSDAFSEMFGDLQTEPRRWTVSKFKNLAARQAQTFARPGVSRSTTACTGTINFGGMMSDANNRRLQDLMPELGIAIREERTSNDVIRNYEVSIPAIFQAMESLRASNPKRAAEIFSELASFQEALDHEAAFKLPIIEEFQELYPHEGLISPLMTDWDSVQAFLEHQGVDLARCSATA